MQTLAYLCATTVAKNNKISTDEFQDCEEIREQLFKILKPIDQIAYLGELKIFHRNDNPKLHAKFLGDKRHGLYLEWYSNGQLRKHVNYINGEEHGKFCIWYENGVQKSLKNYIHGKINGIRKSWHQNGTLISEDYLKNGRVHGKAMNRRENYTIYSNYRESIRHGEYKIINHSGIVIKHDLFIDDIKVMSYLD